MVSRTLRQYTVGNAAITGDGRQWRLTMRDATAHAYSDAQLDDYAAGAAQRLLQGPPLRLRLRARFSHPAGALRGTAGFGFWNYPLVAGERRLPRLPAAVWFFHASPPSDLKLDLHTPGDGFKASTIDAGHPAALALLPFAPVAVPLMNRPALYKRIWPPIQRACGIAEAAITAEMTDWHDYELHWGTRYSSFRVDGRMVLDHAPSPRGPLCFVAWVDNQYMVVKPWGRFAWGLLDAPGEQWMEIGDLRITVP
jgi:hypothetical protein